MDIDILCKNCISKNEIYADAFNYYLFQGKKKIIPQDLKEVDTSIPLLIKNNNIQRYRDIFKICSIKNDNKNTYILLGIENQTSIDKTMLFRCMVYDSLSYLKQFEEIEKKNKNDKIKLKPIITLVIYFGTHKWNNYKDLYTILDFRGIEELKYLIPNYKLNIISPNEINDNDFSKMESELRLILKYIKNSKDKDRLIKILEDDKGYKNISKEAMLIISKITKTEIKIDEDGEIDMCKAIDDLKKDAKKEGILLGRQEGFFEAKKESALNLYKNGVSIEIISKSLNVDEKTIIDILKENNLIN